MKKTYGLIILDGFGLNDETTGNAIAKAGVPYILSLRDKYPHSRLGASGSDVGLPAGQMGNSEVGHLNMGAGRIVYQDLTRITKAIESGELFENRCILDCMRATRRNGRKLHLYGLLSDGGVHSHIEHLFALIRMAKAEGLDEAYVHCFLDGRDVPPTSGAGYAKRLVDFMAEEGFGRIASVMGRYYAMDRDNRWERVERAYDALTLGVGEKFSDPIEAIESSYASGVTDEFATPKTICSDGKPIATISRGDGIIFFNFRPDRARELTRAFIMRDFDFFERKTGFLRPSYVGMTQYDASFAPHLCTAFRPDSLKNTLGEYLSSLGLRQLRIAETEKYAHVTFFFNGGVERPNELEDRVLIPSPKVPNYDLQPEMSAEQVADKAVSLIGTGEYDVVILNFANCDMVGHTGVFDAAVKAVETVDAQLKKVVDALLSTGGEAIVTADHGNADKLFDEHGPFTAHTLSPVPIILVTDRKVRMKPGGTLADVAPTFLKLMGAPQPVEMTGRALFDFA